MKRNLAFLFVYAIVSIAAFGQVATTHFHKAGCGQDCCAGKTCSDDCCTSKTCKDDCCAKAMCVPDCCAHAAHK